MKGLFQNSKHSMTLMNSLDNQLYKKIKERALREKKDRKQNSSMAMDYSSDSSNDTLCDPKEKAELYV